MKKIIATVLAMVMALALCVTAFAATTSNSVDSKDYSMKEMDNITVYTINKDSQITIVKRDAEKTTVGNTTTTTYFADKYVINGSDFYACDSSIAEYKLIKDGKVVAYLSTNTALANGTKAVVTKAIEAKETKDQTCGDYTVDVFMIDGKAYAVDKTGNSTDVAMLNGLAVTYDGSKPVDAIAHNVNWTDKDSKATPSYNAKGEVVSVKCACGTTFEVVKKVPSTYTGETQKVGDYYVLLGSKNPTNPTTTNGSPKTFDAGIAMYAGMALMSVAGSAVVIGKKKEF